VTFIGNRMAFIGFADVGLLWDQSLGLSKALYQGYGVGIRFRNENLIFPTFQFLIGYYPRGFATGAQFAISSQNRSYFLYDQLVVSRPGVIQF
jgi:hypothetical protein